ncbi:MAG: hypothetical protein J6R43_06825 [Paludibacteraceae bacterium]|nr:hypothetical protein [Paludibacteraceae bacterium]
MDALNKFPSLVLGLLMACGFIFTQVLDGLAGTAFVLYTMLFWELWYLKVLGSTREKATEYYDGVVGRFKASVGLILSVESIFLLLSVLFVFVPNVVPAAVIGMAKSARFLVHSVLFIWQISMLMNAIAATMSAEEYKSERGKIVMMLVFAPIGAMTMHNS